MGLIRTPLAPVAILIVVGFGALTTVSSRPRFAAYHWVDVIQLLGAGACFGVAMAILGFSRRRHGSVW